MDTVLSCENSFVPPLFPCNFWLLPPRCWYETKLRVVDRMRFAIAQMHARTCNASVVGDARHDVKKRKTVYKRWFFISIYRCWVFVMDIKFIKWFFFWTRFDILNSTTFSSRSHRLLATSLFWVSINVFGLCFSKRCLPLKTFSYRWPFENRNRYADRWVPVAAAVE